MKRKFDIAYMLCKEGLVFTKMEAVCELEDRLQEQPSMCYVY